MWTDQTSGHVEKLGSELDFSQPDAGKDDIQIVNGKRNPNPRYFPVKRIELARRLVRVTFSGQLTSGVVKGAHSNLSSSDCRSLRRPRYPAPFRILRAPRVDCCQPCQLRTLLLLAHGTDSRMNTPSLEESDPMAGGRLLTTPVKRSKNQSFACFTPPV